MDNDMILAGARTVEEAIEAQDQLNRFISSQMRENVDYGIIPGTPKKSLWQPGAQKLLYFNGLGVRLEPGPGTVIDWKGGFFNYEYKAVAFYKRTGNVVAECWGSANSMESCFKRKKWVPEARIPAGIKKEDLETKEGDGGKVLYALDITDTHSLPNSISKRAQKRAMVGVALLACRASENFTHSEDDDEEEGGERKSSSASTESSGGKSNVISDAQRKRLYAITKSAGVSENDVAAHLREKYPYTVDEEGSVRTSRISWRDYEAICKWVEGQKKA